MVIILALLQGCFTRPRKYKRVVFLSEILTVDCAAISAQPILLKLAHIKPWIVRTYWRQLEKNLSSRLENIRNLFKT